MAAQDMAVDSEDKHGMPVGGGHGKGDVMHGACALRIPDGDLQTVTNVTFASHTAGLHLLPRLQQPSNDAVATWMLKWQLAGGTYSPQCARRSCSLLLPTTSG